MVCAWYELLSVLPLWLREYTDKLDRETLQEIRLRINSPPEFVLSSGSVWNTRLISAEDIHFCINMASRYSPWSQTGYSSGYISISGGHRIGLCGTAVVKDGKMTGFQSISSLCIRVAKDFPNLGNEAESGWQSILIIGAPGWGKTTLLRGIARTLSKKHTVGVVDARGELFPSGVQTGKRMDIISGCSKKDGIEILLRTMGPEYIALDEITAESDSEAVLNAHGCGVQLLATAHADSVQDMKKRKLYRMLLDCGVFQTLIVLHRNKTYCMERLTG